ALSFCLSMILSENRYHFSGSCLACVGFAHSSPLMTCRERSLQLPGSLEARRIGFLEKPSPGRVEILHAVIAVFRGPPRPVRHRHRNGDTPLPPSRLRVTLVPQSYAADQMTIIADEVIVLDVGPFETGLERDRFGHGSSGNSHGHLGSVRHQFSGGAGGFSASTASALLVSPPATCLAASGDSA